MKIHFIGIGGIGVSALAQYYLEKGHEISGSDLFSSEITDFLKNRGVKITIGNLPENISKDMNLVIYSPAVEKKNPELLKARKYNIKIMSYPEALGKLTEQYFTIAIAGAHGKSTTTAMIGLILQKAGLDPTVIVGTKLKEFGGSNFKMGKSRYLVIEACEYDSSFNNYSPKITVVTNIDKEHLDYFKSLKNIISIFRSFILKLQEDGFLVANEDDKNISKVLKSKFLIPNKFSIVKFSIKQKEAKELKKILKIPGQHNIYNALAALTVARVLEIPDEVSFKALSQYRGSWRRFEVKTAELTRLPAGRQGTSRRKTREITVVSDYGHHPTEIKATLQSAREKYPKKKIWCIFQPHQYQRTYYLFKDFVRVFRKVPVDNVMITDIHDVAGREEKKISSSVNSKNLVKKIKRKNVKYFSVNEAEKYVKENIKSGEVLIIMGAGDIYKLVEKF